MVHLGSGAVLQPELADGPHNVHGYRVEDFPPQWVRFFRKRPLEVVLHLVSVLVLESVKLL